MDASTFLRISSTARAVPVGRAPKNHRRKGGGAIDQPQKEWGVNGGFGADVPVSQILSLFFKTRCAKDGQITL